MMLGLSSASATWNEASLLPSLALHDAFFCKLSDMMVPSKKKPTAGEAAASMTARPPTVVDRKSTQKPEIGQPKANGNAAGKKRKNTAEQISKIAKRAREGGLQQHSKEDETLTNSDVGDQANIVTSNSIQQEKNVQLDIDMTSSSSAPQGSHIESLREKLMKKIESLRVQRQTTLPDGSTISSDGNIVPSQPTHNGISKRAARRQLKEQRRQIATTKAKANNTTPADASSSSPKPFVDNTTLLRKLSNVISASTSSTTQTTTTIPTVPEDLSGIDFGTLTGLASSHSTSIKDNKSLINIGKKKSLESLLTEAEKKKARLKELKQSEQAEDQQRATQMEWKETLMLASGAKTKDSDPNLLKKAIKRKLKKKAKSEEGWKTRLHQKKDHMNQRQQIRSHNVQMRKVGGSVGANLSKKQIKSEDSGHSIDKGKPNKQPQDNKKHLNRAGFEGKRHQFINHGKKS